MAQILPIVCNPAPLLRQRAKEVDLLSLKESSTQALIDDMVATMWQEDGIGIAAPQVGQSIRMIIITKGPEAIALVNPVITSRSFRKDVMEEGCLSVPGFYGPVKRSIAVQVTAFDRHGSALAFKAEGLAARIMQHEIDHLDGVLFIDRAKKVYSVDTAAKL